MRKSFALVGACLLLGCIPAQSPVADSQAVRQPLDASVSNAPRGSFELRNVRAFLRSGAWLAEPRIFGGEPARPGQDPWQVALVPAEEAQNVAFCGGSLIAPNIVLTAAHCVDNGTLPGEVDVVAGTVDLTSGGQRLHVTRFAIHYDYNSTTYDNDLALVFLAGATSAGLVAPATLADENSAGRPGQRARVTGWGRTETSTSTVRQLMAASVPIVSNTDCNDPVAWDNTITPNMLCAGDETADACKGDSGGPLTVAVGGSRALLGIVSSGPRRCGQLNKYGVYTRIARYTAWIASCAAGRSCAR